jgi:hypothetical protein
VRANEIVLFDNRGRHVPHTEFSIRQGGRRFAILVHDPTSCDEIENYLVFTGDLIEKLREYVSSSQN